MTEVAVSRSEQGRRKAKAETRDGTELECHASAHASASASAIQAVLLRSAADSRIAAAAPRCLHQKKITSSSHVTASHRITLHVIIAFIAWSRNSS